MSNATQTSIDTTRQIVATNLSKALDEQRWSERKAAAALGLTPAYVNRRATGDTEMSASDLAMFAQFLGMRVQDFFKAPTTDYGYGGSLASVTELHPRRAQTPEGDRIATVTAIGL